MPLHAWNATLAWVFITIQAWVNGKTIIALTWLRDALKNGIIADALVICPASLVPNWKKDIAECTEFDHMTDEDVKVLQEKVTITSFQKTYRTYKKIINHRDGQPEEVKKRMIREELDKPWGAIIIDEAHAIGNHSSVQTKTALALAKTTHYRYILTGTPVSGSTQTGGADYSKLYGQMKFLHPDIWGSWTEFCRRYVTAYTEFKSPAAYNIKDLNQLMLDNAIAMRLRDCFDLPEATEMVQYCPLMEKKVYKDLREHKIDEYDLENVKATVVKLRQLCSGSLITDKGVRTYDTSKEQALLELLEGTDDKVVIFCTFTASIDRCAEICRKAGRGTIIYDGRSKGPTWEEFSKPENTAIVCHFQSGGTGLNLQAASTMIMYEPIYSSLDWTQAKRRIERPGQQNRMRYVYLCTPKTVEEKVLRTVMSGKSVTDKMIEGWAKNNEI